MFYFLLIFTKKLKDDVKSLKDYTDLNMLLAIQNILPRTDSKDFVDMPKKKPLNEIIKEFRRIEPKLGIRNDKISISIAEKVHSLKQDKTSVEILQKFIKENFYPVGSDISYHMPEDFNSNPLFIKPLKNIELKNMGLRLNEVWKDLSRKKAHLPEYSTSTLIDLPHPFMIPGGRFREFYYWDTYFILEGLLVCGMNKTAFNILDNFIYILDTIGYIPNGIRKYYENRTEPPFFSQMLLKLLDVDPEKGNELILGKGLEMAIKEMKFFDKNKSIKVKGKNGKTYKLNYYHVETNYPRPESFAEDIESFERQNSQSATDLFTNIKSGAESGWDFSSRWFLDETDISTIIASKQIPVDLNALLYRSEIIISHLSERKGDMKTADEFMERANKRKEAINQVLWNDEENTWMDYNIKTGKFVDRRFYFSNITPLIYGIEPPGEVNNYDILKKYKFELFGYPGGVPVSGDGPETGQQWDFPNAWAPHQHMLVEYLININEEEMAFNVAKRFFNSAIEGFRVSNTFFEKYDVLHLGSTGGGGEYEPQEGFGWTNGVILAYIKYYGDKLMDDFNYEESLAKISSILDSKAGLNSQYNKNMVYSFFGVKPISKAD